MGKLYQLIDSLQNYIAKIKALTSTSLPDLDNLRSQNKDPSKANITEDTLAELDRLSSEIRRSDSLVGCLDNYCSVLPIIVKEITTAHSEDQEALAFVKNLVLVSIGVTLSLFQLYFKIHFRRNEFDKAKTQKEKFLVFRAVDYVRVLQILSWFSPIQPNLKPLNKKLCNELEPILKSVESENMYQAIDYRFQKIAVFWKSQAERDVIHSGRSVPE